MWDEINAVILHIIELLGGLIVIGCLIGFTLLLIFGVIVSVYCCKGDDFADEETDE